MFNFRTGLWLFCKLQQASPFLQHVIDEIHSLMQSLKMNAGANPTNSKFTTTTL
jgi:hypothetical protein